MRAFLAVPADPAWAESASVLLASLRQSLPKASWTRPESWHLTLKFLGEVSQADAESFAGAMGPRVAEAVGGELVGARPVMFPPRGRPRVLGVGFAPGGVAETLEALGSAAEIEARKIGVAPDGKSFHPHVTLGRIRDPWPPAAVEEFARAVGGWTFPAWSVRSCVLYRSRLDPAGAVHTPIREWAMAGAVPETRS